MKWQPDRDPAAFALAAARGVGQVFFQDNAATGALFLLGIAWSSPLMAAGAIVGAVLGTATARLLKFDDAETTAGIYGFNATLVGIASLFFFRPGAASLGLLVVGCVAATLLTRARLPFPTYTAPFIVTTWAIFFLGTAMGAERVVHPGPADVAPWVGAVQGVSQVMFQADVATAALFLAGLAVGNWRHAAWVLAGSVVGAMVGGWHATGASRLLDPESLVVRPLFENIALGLYGYNATLAAVALSLWRRSSIPPLLGMLLAVLLTDLVPLLGLPALTAPFVLATWLVLALGKLDETFLADRGAKVA
ncbi:urea transporter [Planctomyces sp. SH-PL62]|uniref:urea transporter n=1 Tax=Planctomyces sp. SH-PL62 TaxID=1636152 RepID=UPI00078EBDB7|nr:urea transporter [Planctomyces sp. SH-PL62]AMV38283.1 Urea transporter [Planctomyces sp. SH-PL62]